MRIDLLASFVMLLPAFVAEATRGFTYNDDVACGYPFEDFTIESITCAPSTFVHVLVDGAQDVVLYENEEVCAFGNEMDIVGRVTISQPISKWYYLHLNVCFKSSQVAWYANKKCMLFKSSMDMVRSNTQADNAWADQGENAEEDQAAANQATTYQAQQILDYAEPGVYTFKSRVIIPHKTFTFKADYMVAAELSLVPGAHSVYVDTYKFTTICTASFNAVQDQYNNTRYSNRYAAAFVLTVGLICGAFVVGGKTRRLCTEGDEEAAIAEKPDNHFVIMHTVEREIENDTEQEPTTASLSVFKEQSPRARGLSRFSISKFFRRQTRETVVTQRHSASSTVDSGVRESECSVEHRSVELSFQKL